MFLLRISLIFIAIQQVFNASYQLYCYDDPATKEGNGCAGEYQTMYDLEVPFSPQGYAEISYPACPFYIRQPGLALDWECGLATPTSYYAVNKSILHYCRIRNNDFDWKYYTAAMRLHFSTNCTTQ